MINFSSVKSDVLSDELKNKVIRSYIRGEDNYTNGILKGLTEQQVEQIVAQAWKEAENTGEKLEISLNRFMTENQILMIGECAKYQGAGRYRKEFKLAETAMRKVLNLYGYMTGNVPEVGRINLKDTFEKVPGKTLTNCPCCGNKKLNLIATDGTVAEFAAVLKVYKLTSADIKKNAFCPSCFTEFFEVQHVADQLLDGKKVRVPADHELNGIVKLNYWAMKEV